MTEEESRQATKVLTSIATPMRIRMIKMMLDGEIAVIEMARRIGLRQSTTSMHLIRLKAVGMVDQRKFQQMRYYSITSEWRDFLRLLITIAEAQPTRRSPLLRP